MPPRDCPCTSGRSYAECCAPYHRLVREAPDPVALMRSRYAAFATKNVEYLWRTLHADHDDRARPKEATLRAIREACQTNRYMGLEILEPPCRTHGDIPLPSVGDHQPPDGLAVAHVTFHAKVFTRGKDVSFVERSEFLHDGEGWRYLTGTLIEPRPAGAGEGRT